MMVKVVYQEGVIILSLYVFFNIFLKFIKDKLIEFDNC